LEKERENAFYKINRGENKKGDLKKDVLKKIENQKGKQKELLKIYIKYQKKLKEKKLYDFSDMILSVVQEAEKNLDFREKLQEKFLYLLVDEHQDTNNAQSKLIELISEAKVNENKPNIFTVGDEKQAIYRFQGASLDNFHSFKKKYSDVKIIHLEKNYRSSQNILDTSHQILSGEKKLVAENENFSKEKTKIKLGEFFDKKSELIFLAENIQEKINSGTNPKDIAVFYKQNNELGEIKNMLEKFSIPFSISSRENILDNGEIKKIILLLEAIENPYDNEKLGKSLFINFLNFNPHDILKIFEKMANRKGKQIKNKSILKIISTKEILEKMEISEVEKFLNFSDFLKKMKKEEMNLDFLEFFQKIINDSGFLKYLLKSKNNISSLNRLEKIFNEIKKQFSRKNDYSLEDFLNYISILKKYELKIEVGKNNLLDGVNLMTAHGSKGLEFEHVYITNFIDSKWGGTRKRGEAFILPTSKVVGDIDDERRLFYVALTRGKKEVNILFSKVDIEGKEKISSRFLEEIPEEFFEKYSIEEKKYEEKIKIYFSQKEEKILSIFDKEYIKKLFLENTLSVSALNNYFQSPIKYFFRNLVRLPSAQAKPLIFGNIIHDALESYFRLGKKEKKTPEKKKMIEIFEESMEKFSIPEKYFDEIKSHGKKVLEKYFDRYSDNFNFDVETEKKMYAEISLNNGEILKLYGIVDKMEKLDGGKIRVIDYKTGKTFSEKNKNQKEDLERQIVFYKLLIDKFYNDNRVEEGILDFVEESKKTEEFVREKRFISQEDVQNLEEEIKNFAEDILSGNFLDRKYEKNEENKEYFEFWELLKK
jgi:DNA helicase-2/ATP-dependent DNA helicase PcrA